MKVLVLQICLFFPFFLDAQAALRLSSALFDAPDLPQGSLSYAFAQPDSLDKTRVYPLILFLHGAGERGHGNPDFALTHLRPFLDIASEDYPCFVLAPQCPKGLRWVEHNWSAKAHTQDAEPGKALAAAKDLLDGILEEYMQIDRNRIYVVGLSMGGFGTWEFVARWPDYVAAAVPICGGGDPAQAAQYLDIPLHIFHGAKDRLVWPIRSQEMYKALRKAGLQELEYTEYPTVGHDAWKPSLSSPELKHWLFSQVRSE